MRNLNIQASYDELQDHAYRVSRSSSAYSFFHCEFHNLPEDFYGNLIVPSTHRAEKNSKRIGALQALKEKLLRRDDSVRVRIGSKEHMYFATEYQRSMVVGSGDIIVPGDEYPKSKTR